MYRPDGGAWVDGLGGRGGAAGGRTGGKLTPPAVGPSLPLLLLLSAPPLRAVPPAVRLPLAAPPLLAAPPRQTAGAAAGRLPGWPVLRHHPRPRYRKRACHSHPRPQHMWQRRACGRHWTAAGSELQCTGERRGPGLQHVLGTQTDRRSAACGGAVWKEGERRASSGATQGARTTSSGCANHRRAGRARQTRQPAPRGQTAAHATSD